MWADDFAASCGRAPQAVARDVAAILARYASEVDEQGRFPAESVQALKSSGLMGLTVPRAFGGLGAPVRTLALVAEELAAACTSTAMIWAMHCQQVAVLADHASDWLKQQVLPRVAREGMYIASVTTERGTGGHLFSSFSPLTASGDSVLLDREAPVVTGGTSADGYLITVRRSQSSSPSDVILVFADRSQVEVTVNAGWDAMGMRGTQSVSMKLTGRLPAGQLVDPPQGFRYVAVRTMIPVGHIVWAACWLGTARGAFGAVVRLLRDRRSNSGKALQSDLLASRLARAQMQIDLSAAYLNEVIREYEALREDGVTNLALESREFQMKINNLKILASEQLFSAVDQLIQIQGLRYGYMRNGEAPLERAFRDLRSASLMYANDQLLILNGKLALLGSANSSNGRGREET